MADMLDELLDEIRKGSRAGEEAQRTLDVMLRHMQEEAGEAPQSGGVSAQAAAAATGADAPVPLAPEREGGADSTAFVGPPAPSDATLLTEGLAGTFDPVIDLLKELVEATKAAKEKPEKTEEEKKKEAEEKAKKEKAKKDKESDNAFSQGMGLIGMLFGGRAGFALNAAKDAREGAKDISGGMEQGGVGGGLQAAGGVMAMVAGPAAALAAGFTAITDQIQGFVQAVNPAVMRQFGMVMHDLSASIGTALVPLMQSMVGAGREMADALLPVMQSIKPVVEQLAGTLSKLAANYSVFVANLIKTVQPLAEVFVALVGVLAPLVNLYQSMVGIVLNLVMTALTPLMFTLKQFASLMDLISPLFDGLTLAMAGLQGVFEVLVESIAGMFNFDAKEIFDALKNAIQTMAAFIIKLVAYLAGFVGAQRGFVRGVTRALGGEKTDSTGVGVGTNAQIGSIQSLSQNIMRSSLLAGASGGKSKEEQWREDLLKELKSVGEQDFLKQNWEKLMDAIARIAEALGASRKAFNQARSLAEDTARYNPSVALGPAGLAIGFARTLLNRGESRDG